MAAKFWVGGGTNTNWNSSPVTNWANSSGGAGNQTVPGVGDDVTFDGVGASANGPSIISATISCLSLTITSGYTNTMTHNAVLTIAGNWTFHAGYTIAGASGVTISAASTIDSNTKTWPNGLTFTGANTKTLAENLTIGGTLTISGATVITSNVLTVGGLLVNGATSGTATITMTGGTWSGSSTLNNSITIAGNVTLSGSVFYNTGTITYSSGTVTPGASTLSISGSCTLNTAGISFNNITFSAAATITINSLLTANGTLQIAAGAAMTFAGTAGFYVNSFSALNTTAATHTFKNGVTYTIYGFFLSYLAPNSGGNIFTSDDGALRTNIVLLNSVSQSLTNGRFTRVDASAGRAIWTLNGTVTDCLNIFSLTNLSFVTGKTQVIQGFSNY